MGFTGKERAWAQFSVIKLGITIAIYVFFGTWLVSLVNGLDGLEPIAANLIVFGTIGLVVSTCIDIVDKKRI